MSPDRRRCSLSQVVVHDLGQARAVLAAAAEAGLEVRLRSAPDAAGYAGVGYLQALGAAAGHELVVDCGDDAGLVMAALRTGLGRLVFSGPQEVHAPLADMARQLGADLVHEVERPDLLEFAPDEATPSIRRRFEQGPEKIETAT